MATLRDVIKRNKQLHRKQVELMNASEKQANAINTLSIKLQTLNSEFNAFIKRIDA